ncbi:MAG: hypothetical protein ACYTFW_24490, partial [Planctomycetota bacterium]
MRGNVKLKRINKKTGETDILFEDSNQTTTGFGHTIVNILTGQGSRNLEDYQVGYFQLGSEAYDLDPEFDDFGMSADVGVSANIPFFWTLKSAFSEADYGNDSRSAIVKRRQYGFGSYVPSGAPTTALFSNFIQPPETTKTLYDYADRFYLFPSGTPTGGANGSGIFVAGCANAWEGTEGNGDQGEYPMYHELLPLDDRQSKGVNIQGPDNQDTTFHIYYNRSRKPPTSSCLRPGTEYVYAEDGRKPAVWRYAVSAQTQSYYWKPDYYYSGQGTTSGSTVLTARNQLFNRSAQSFVNSAAGQNRVHYKAIYVALGDLTRLGLSRYTPIILDASSGYELCLDSPGCDDDKFISEFGSEGGGIVSGNVANRFGYIYTYNDVTGCGNGPYKCFSGPGAPYMTQASAGFGPDGQWFRLTASWVNVPSGITEYRRQGGAVMQAMLFPMLSSLDTIDNTGYTQIYDQSAGITFGDLGNNAQNKTPRPAAYIADFQYDDLPYPTAKQKILGEKPYYITQDNHFVKVPRSYTTSLNDNTVNVRLLIDENMAVGQTIKEIGLFSKNPNGNRGVDQPYLIAYKSLCDPLIKNDEFSYIVDWELSVID